MPAGDRFVARFFFDARSGICLWAGDDATCAAFEYPIDHRSLAVSPATRREVDRVLQLYDSSFDWDDPAGPGPWDEDEHRRFAAEADALLVRLRSELGDAWELRDERR